MNINACIILAAGRNSRLDTGIPKSLLKAGEQSLIERQITVLNSFGIEQFCVVVGYQKEKLSEELNRIAAQHHIDIEIAVNMDWELENGYSLYSAKKWIEQYQIENFYFTMADHYFSLPFLEDVNDNIEFIENNTLQLVVDKPGEHNKHIDIEDVTRVLVEKNRILKIGKMIPEYNFYDTGLFYAKSMIFNTLEKLVHEGACSISKMVSRLCEAKKAGVTAVGSHFWNDVDNEADLLSTLEWVNEKNKQLETL